MDETRETQSRSRAAGAVCAHLGIGVDDEQAKIARDRLNKSLASYRVALLGEERAEPEAVGS